MDETELRLALLRFKHALRHYRHWSRAFYCTEGVAFLVEEAGIHWFLDHIAARQRSVRRDPELQELQVWTLHATGRFTARISCLHREGDEAFHADIQLFGACSIAEATVVLRGDLLRLPSER